MGKLWSQCRRALKRQLNKLLVAVGGQEVHIRLLRRAGMRIGENCRIYTEHFGGEPWLIRIGNHCTITSGVRFVTHDGSCWVLRDKYPNLQDFGPIRIEDNCFIGVNAVILPNVRIGPNSIVAAGSVVTSDVPPDTVVAGVPGRRIMSLEEFEQKKTHGPDSQTVPSDPVRRRQYLEEKSRRMLMDD